MTDVALTATKIAPVYALEHEIYTFIAGTTITAGQSVCLTIATGKLDLADANGSGNTLQVRGIALNGGGAGDSIAVLKRGWVEGFTVSGLAYDLVIYQSNTAGALGDSAGGSSIYVGRILPLPDAPTLTKCLYVDVLWRGPNWS
jgi:hypothetical protein